MKSQLIFSVLFFILTQNIHAQNLKFDNSCDAIKFFLFSKEVANNFKSENKNDSIIFIIDFTHALDICAISNWRGKPISILREGPLVDSVKKNDFYRVTAGRSNIYLFYASDLKSSSGNFMIQHGSNNILSSVEFIRKGKKYFLRRIMNGVR